MEKDIKILEEKLRQWEPYKNIKFKTDIELELQMENRAIENLIRGYRDIEEKLKITVAMLTKGTYPSKNDENNFDKQFIPKSKIKEKIEELDKEEKDLQDNISDEEREEYSDATIGYGLMLIENQRRVLQELMEDKNEFREVFKNAKTLKPIPNTRLEDK